MLTALSEKGQMFLPRCTSQYLVQGFGALYAGVLPALISVAPSGAVFYGTYDLMKVPNGLAPAAFAGDSCRTSSVAECKALSR